jgi:ABC-type glutathione transport system ATPase component
MIAIALSCHPTVADNRPWPSTSPRKANLRELDADRPTQPGIVLISHDLEVIANLDFALLMYAGVSRKRTYGGSLSTTQHPAIARASVNLRPIGSRQLV